MKRFLPLSLIFLLLPSIAFAAGGTLGLSNNTSTLTNGLAGYWPLDGNKTNWLNGTTQDVSGNGSTASLVKMSTTTSPAPGKIAQALSFGLPGSEYVATPFNPSLYTNITVSLWVKITAATNSTSAAGRFLFSSSDGTANRFYIRTINGDTADLQIGLSSWSTVESNALKLNTWALYTLVLNGTNGYFYINGKLVDSASGLTVSLPNKLTDIGNAGPVDGETADAALFGSIDDVRTYNRALSAQEVGQLYTTGLATVDHSSTVTLQSGLAAYWPMDGNTTNWNIDATIDASGNGNLGQLISMSTTSSPVTGKIGQALNFNGTTQYIAAAKGASIPATSAALSICSWVKTLYVGTGNFPRLISWFDGSQTLEMGVGGNGSTLQGFYLAVSSAGTVAVAGSSMTYAPNKWYYVCATSNGAGSYNLYVNGASDSANTSAYNGIVYFTGNSTTLYIGQRGDSARFWQGSIDDMRIYNRALSAQEVKLLNGNGVTTIGHSVTTTASQNGLLMYYTFDGPKINWATGSVFDSSGNNFTGSLVLIPTSTSPAAGKIGQGLNFKAVATARVQTPSLGAPPVNMSEAVWIKPNASGGVVMDELGTPDQSGWHDSQIEVETNNTINVCVWTGTETCTTAATGITYGKWYHVVLTYNSTTQVLSGYTNGTLGSSLVLSPARQTPSTGNLFYGIGYGDITNGGNPSAFSGVIDDVRVYSKTLSASDVNALYQLGR